MFNENLSLIRFSWKLSQDRFAQMMGVTKAMYQSYESGLRNPSADFIFKVEDLTGIQGKRLWTEKVSLKDIPDKPLEKEAKTYGQKTNEFMGVQESESPLYGEIQKIKDVVADLEKRVLATH